MAVVAQALQLAAPELHPVTPVRLYVIRHVSWGDPPLPLAVPAQRLLLELCGPLCSPSAIRVPVGVLALSHSGSAGCPTGSAPDSAPRLPRAQGGCSTSTRQPACPGPPRWRSSGPPSDSAPPLPAALPRSSLASPLIALPTASLAASTVPMAAASTFLPRALALALRSASALLRRSHALHAIPSPSSPITLHASYASISPRWTASASAPTPIAAATSAAPR